MSIHGSSLANFNFFLVACYNIVIWYDEMDFAKKTVQFYNFPNNLRLQNVESNCDISPVLCVVHSFCSRNVLCVILEQGRSLSKYKGQKLK